MTWSPRPSKNALEQTIDGLVANDSFVARHCGTTTTCMTCIICITLQHNMHHTATQHASHCNTIYPPSLPVCRAATDAASIHAHVCCLSPNMRMYAVSVHTCACMLLQSIHAHVCCLSAYMRITLNHCSQESNPMRTHKHTYTHTHTHTHIRTYIHTHTHTFAFTFKDKKSVQIV